MLQTTIGSRSGGRLVWGCQASATLWIWLHCASMRGLYARIRTLACVLQHKVAIRERVVRETKR